MHRSLLLASLLLLPACRSTDPLETNLDMSASESALREEGMVRLLIPQQDPGAPLYTRITPLANQFFHTDGWLVIPFYRDPSCVPASFNLLTHMDFPGPAGPGAFGCPLTTHGSLIIESDAPLGTFPKIVTTSGDAVPFWFVRWDDFRAAMSDDIVTIEELRTLSPIAGVAESFSETLRPRLTEHHVVINARGRLEDGRSFNFHVTHAGDRTTAIQLRFR